jgi:AraC family transcriptional regulator, transcriptional activator of pobA
MIKFPVTDFNINFIENGNHELIEIKEGWLNTRSVLNVPHRHIFHELIWIIKGPDYHTVDYENYVLKDNHILFIPKDSVHDYKPNPNAQGWKLIFADNFFTSGQFKIIKDFLIFIPCLGNKHLKLNKDSSAVIGSYFSLLKSLTSKSQKQTLIISLLTFIEECYNAEPTLKDTVFIHFLRLLNASIYTNNSVSFYTERLNVSDKTLSSTVKNATGKTTCDYIHSRLILEAKRKLISTNQSIKEIAHSIGFNDALYFSRLFKKKSGISPDEFRKINT